MTTTKRQKANHAVPILTKFGRNMTIVFGAMVMVLMLGVAAAGSFFYSRVSEQQERELQETITELLAHSINRISFSGKYHARLLVKQIADTNPRISYIAITDRSGQSIADSASGEGEESTIELDEDSLRRILKDERALFINKTMDGIHIREVAMPYRSGYENRTSGVIVVGISAEEGDRARTKAHLILLGLVLALSALSLVAVTVLSRRLAKPVTRQAWQFRGVLDHVPLMVCICDEEGNVLEQSEHFRKMNPDGRNLLREEILAVFSHAKPVESETSFVVGEEEMTCLVTSFPILGDTNDKVLLACSIAMDVTQRKQSEDELLAARNYISGIVDSMPSFIVGLSPDGIVTQWNRTAMELTGISAASANGKKLTELDPKMGEYLDCIEKSMETGEVIKTQSRKVSSKGEIRYEDIFVFPLLAGSQKGAVLRIDDVTEKMRLEEALVHSEKMLSVGGLAAGMAHEINNPLAGMLQTSALITRRLDGNSTVPANLKAAKQAGTTIEAIGAYMEDRSIPLLLDNIIDAGKRVASIVDNMLSFARTSDTISSTNSIPVLTDKALELATTEYDPKRSYDFKRIRIIKDYQNGVPAIPCEGTKIQQVILNILRNGAQAMQEAETLDPQFKLSVSYQPEIERVILSISDNGPGMSEDVRKRVFEPFFTTKAVGLGTGLGLSVSYFIITQNHCGEMTVDSQPSRGSKFTIQLPVQK